MDEVGFEPTVLKYNSLANYHFKPLSHSSKNNIPAIRLELITNNGIDFKSTAFTIPPSGLPLYQ
jgi:hypothetical protein